MGYKKEIKWKYCKSLNISGFEQGNGECYDESLISWPVTNDSIIRVMFIILPMTIYDTHIVDIKGFLHRKFDNGEVIYFKVPQWFEAHCGEHEYYLLLVKTAYRLKQAAIMFWKELLKAMEYMGFKRSWEDLCLYSKDIEHGVVIWLSWIDICLCIGLNNQVEKSVKEMKT